MPVSINRFTGHGTAGIVFVVIATWWTISIMRRYFQQLSKNQPFKSTPWYPPQSCSKHPIEPILKFIVVLAYFILSWHDYIGGLLHDDGTAETVGPHAVFVGMYLLVPITELLQYYQCTVLGGIESVPFAAHVLALLSGVLAFGFHSHGRMVVDVHLHKLLAMCVVFALIGSLAECKYRKSIMASLFKTFSYCMTGLWTFCVAFIINSQIDWIPIWDLKKMENVTLATSLYVFLMMCTFVHMSLIACIVGRPYKHLLYESQAKCLGTSANGIANGGKTV